MWKWLFNFPTLMWSGRPCRISRNTFISMNISNLNITLHVLVLVHCVKCVFMHKMAGTFLDQLTQRCRSQLLFRFGQLIIFPPLSRRTWPFLSRWWQLKYLLSFHPYLWGFMIQNLTCAYIFKGVGGSTTNQYSVPALFWIPLDQHVFFGPIPGIWLLKCSSVGLAWTIGFENSAPLTPLEVGGSQHFAPKKSYHKTA